MERLLAVEASLIAALAPEHRTRGRAAVRFSAGLAPWGALFAVVFTAIGQPLLALSLGTAAIGVGLTPWVLRGTGHLTFTAHWLNLFLSQSLLIPAILLGGLRAACVPWFMLCVASATYLAGPAAGATWLVIGSACALGLLWGHLSGAVGPPIVPSNVELGLAALAHVGLFGVGWAAVVAATTTEAQARRDLEAARRDADLANAAKSSFLARMSHELRTPMNAIIGYSELLLEDAEADDADDLSRIRASGTYLLGLVNDILDLSKVDAGQMVFHRQVVPLAPLIHDVVASSAPLFAQRHNTVTVDVAPALCAVADPTRLRPCLLNLLSNAARFTDAGEIHLSARATPGDVQIEVRDSGRGIPADALERIFEPFQQATDDVHAERGGTGLGLALVRQFSEGMGGRISVTSHLGRGSTFTLSLPSVSDATAADA